MKYKYRVSYEETRDALEEICGLYNADSSDITMKVVCVIVGVILLAFNCIYGNPGGGTTEGFLLFLVKFLVIWALLSFVAILINHTLWRKVVDTTSVGDAESSYYRRKAKNNGVLKSQIEFYDNCFRSITEIKKRDFSYDNVVKLVETKKAFGIVIRQRLDELGTRSAVIGFPKSALEDADIEELKAYLLEKCPKVKKKVKKL